MTGAAGYIAGTFIAGTLIWLVFPIVIVIGIVAIFGKSIMSPFVRVFDWTIRKLYFWRNQD
ncbi:MAG: hypothetical protein COB40_12065 [Marinosulfonomonas sp.]|nr:MAG: hypothetical protein COB40_12065 [Marinosulfonomonas sp.]